MSNGRTLGEGESHFGRTLVLVGLGALLTLAMAAFRVSAGEID